MPYYPWSKQSEELYRYYARISRDSFYLLTLLNLSLPFFLSLQLTHMQRLYCSNVAIALNKTISTGTAMALECPGILGKQAKSIQPE
jgi:hypothetical protein